MDVTARKRVNYVTVNPQNFFADKLTTKISYRLQCPKKSLIQTKHSGASSVRVIAGNEYYKLFLQAQHGPIRFIRSLSHDMTIDLMDFDRFQPKEGGKDLLSPVCGFPKLRDPPSQTECNPMLAEVRQYQ